VLSSVKTGVDISMNYIFLLAVTFLLIIVLLYAGYRYLPQKRIFCIFAAIVLVCVSSIIWFSSRYPQQSKVTDSQKMQILSEQPFFVTWYESYKQNIDDIDRVWSRYNNNLNRFSQDDVSLRVLTENLIKNQADIISLQKKLATALPPQELSDTNYKLSYDVLEKTRSYLAAQSETITASVQLLQSPEFLNQPRDIQYKQLDNIRILKSPVNLNISPDISSIRDNLILPDLS
jgi:hypothetical protein